MALRGIKMDVECKTNEVLARLRENRDKHKGMVEEARVGYLKRAEAALQAKLDEIRSGRVKTVYVTLNAPQDMTTVYDTAIEMLTMHTGETITLSGSEFRQLVQDEWDWSDDFLAKNARYSSTVAAAASRKGLDV